MSASPDGPSRPRRTYGRAKAAPPPDNNIPNMLFAAPRESPAKNLLERFSAKSSNWREPLNDLDAEEKETKDEISAARQRFRMAKVDAPSRALAAFSSSTLTNPPSSTPPIKATEPETDVTSPPPPSSPPPAASPIASPGRRPTVSPQPSSPPVSLNADLAESEDATTPRAATLRTIRDSATPVRSPRPDPFADLFDDEEEEEGSGGSHSARRRIKGPTKVEMEEARRDAARALRERAPELSKPEPTRRPISAWFEKAQSAATNPALPRGRLAPSTFTSRAARHPDTSPAEDIRQFPTSQATPSSRGIDWPDRRCSTDQRLVLPSTSSPTPAVRPREHLEDLDDENDEDRTLDDALRREAAEEQERKRWALAKQHALKTRKQAQPVRDSDDDDFVIERFVKPVVRAGPSRPSIASRQMPRMWGQASNRAPKRPSTSRNGRDIHITHTRLTTDLVGRHYEQAHKLQQQREEKYGSSRRLPEKQELELGTIIPASASAEAEDDSDDGDSDFTPDDVDEPDVEVWSGAEDEAVLMPSSEHGSDEEGRQSGADEDEDKENQPIAADSVSDDEDEGLVPLKRRSAKARVAFLSDDEGDGPEKPLQEVARQPLAPTLESGPSPGGFGTDFGGFDGDGDGDGGGGFSQLFAETQGVDAFGEGDAFDQIREQEEAAHRIAPTAALLPSVQISESQKKRDNALIGGDSDELTTPKAYEAKRQYLNSQGFFTQTRPKGLSSQSFSSATQLATNGAELSSTLINSSDRPSDPTSPTTAEPDGDDEMTFTRLRRRRSSAYSPNERPTPTGPLHVIQSSPERPTRPRNAFDLLNAGAARQQKARDKARDSELIDAQAEESDDDAGWGFVAKEAEEDDEEDGFVPELVDDEVLPDDIREAQDALATEKARAMEAEDDARRETEAKKVVEGHYRVKRRGNEFLSDEEDEAGPRMSKKARRQRRIDREDGLFKLGGESNVFLQAYEEDLESDNEFDEAPPSPGLVGSPVMKLSARERDALLKQRARMNTDGAEFSMGDEEEVGGFAIARASRTTIISEDTEDGVRVFAASRSVESYTKFVSEQAANPRRAGGGGVSVVGHGSKPNPPKRTASAASAGPSPGRSLGVKGSVLFERDSRFG
ncbi:hypothetical protein CspHIS471_0704550 [Cutaneotrichosporon sp. HIS471]|nr:hypothetical protein CspHIS471_0704550 [Cutaneotrichosporon sp. HIS471]